MRTSSESCSDGFMPVIFTKPPAGIVRIEYSVSPTCFFQIGGPKNSPNFSTRMPTSFAAVKCPSSWSTISVMKPSAASTQLKP